MLVTFLGTASAFPSRSRASACYLVECEGAALLVDCGEGAADQLARAFADFDELAAVFLSHEHYDHVGGLLGLVATLNLLGRSRRLEVYGPEPALDKLRLLLAAYPADFELVLHPAEAVDYGPLSLTPHRTVDDPQTVAWHVQDRAHAKSVLFGADTGPNARLVAAAQGVDLLIHEATYLQKDVAQARRFNHATAVEAAQAAQAARAQLLALTHLDDRCPDEALLQEAQTVFTAVFAARDFDQVLLEGEISLTRAEAESA